MKNFNFLLVLVLMVVMLAGCVDAEGHPMFHLITPVATTETSALPTVTATPEIVPTVEAVLPTVTPDCTVKGNIDSKGNKIYHLPGDPNYAKTIPEACFSDANAAEAAGYRPINKK